MSSQQPPESGEDTEPTLIDRLFENWEGRFVGVEEYVEKAHTLTGPRNPFYIDGWLNLMDDPNPPGENVPSFTRIMARSIKWLRNMHRRTRANAPWGDGLGFEQLWGYGPNIQKALVANPGFQPKFPNTAIENASESAKKIIYHYLPDITVEAALFTEAAIAEARHKNLLDENDNPINNEAIDKFKEIWANGPPGKLALRILQARDRMPSRPPLDGEGRDPASLEYLNLMYMAGRKAEELSLFNDNYNFRSEFEARQYLLIVHQFLQWPRIRRVAAGDLDKSPFIPEPKEGEQIDPGEESDDPGEGPSGSGA